MYTQASANRMTPTAEAVSVALANNTIKQATENMHQQFDRFLEVFA